MNGEWVGIDDALVRLGINRQTLRQRIKRGQVTARKDDDGRAWAAVYIPAPGESVTAPGETPPSLRALLPPGCVPDEVYRMAIAKISELETRDTLQRERLTDLAGERQRQQEEIALLLRLLAREQEITRALTVERLPWWKRLFGRGRKG